MRTTGTNIAADGGVGAPDPADGASNRTDHQKASSTVTVPGMCSLYQPG